MKNPHEKPSRNRMNWWPIRIHRFETKPLLDEVKARINRAHQMGWSKTVRRPEGVTDDDAIRKALRETIGKWERSANSRKSKPKTDQTVDELERILNRVKNTVIGRAGGTSDNALRRLIQLLSDWEQSAGAQDRDVSGDQ